MIVLFGGEKGGTGKSTLATNYAAFLAREGEDVLLLDCDPQRSASSWASVRANYPELPRVHAMEKLNDVAAAVRDVSKRYAHVVLDAGGRDSRELRSAMLVAEKLYVPIKASQFDLWTAESMNKLIDQAKGFNTGLKAYAVVSMAPTNPVVNEAAEAREMLKEFENLELAKSIIRERKPYRDAVVLGRGVLELDPSRAAKAVYEFSALVQEVTGVQIQPNATSAVNA